MNDELIDYAREMAKRDRECQKAEFVAALMELSLEDQLAFLVDAVKLLADEANREDPLSA